MASAGPLDTLGMGSHPVAGMRQIAMTVLPAGAAVSLTRETTAAPGPTSSSLSRPHRHQETHAWQSPSSSLKATPRHEHAGCRPRQSGACLPPLAAVSAGFRNWLHKKQIQFLNHSVVGFPPNAPSGSIRLEALPPDQTPAHARCAAALHCLTRHLSSPISSCPPTTGFPSKGDGGAVDAVGRFLHPGSAQGELPTLPPVPTAPARCNQSSSYGLPPRVVGGALNTFLRTVRAVGVGARRLRDWVACTASECAPPRGDAHSSEAAGVEDVPRASYPVEGPSSSASTSTLPMAAFIAPPARIYISDVRGPSPHEQGQPAERAGGLPSPQAAPGKLVSTPRQQEAKPPPLLAQVAGLESQQNGEEAGDSADAGVKDERASLHTTGGAEGALLQEGSKPDALLLGSEDSAQGSDADARAQEEELNATPKAEISAPAPPLAGQTPENEAPPASGPPALCHTPNTARGGPAAFSAVSEQALSASERPEKRGEEVQYPAPRSAVAKTSSLPVPPPLETRLCAESPTPYGAEGGSSGASAPEELRAQAALEAVAPPPTAGRPPAAGWRRPETPWIRGSKEPLPTAEERLDRVPSVEGQGGPFSLQTAVGEQLLVALQEGPLGQPAVALRALLALVTADSSSTPPVDAPVNSLLQRGLVDALHRILSSARPPKPFWPRWLQREAEPTNQETVALLQVQLDALQLLQRLLSWGFQAEWHIAAHKELRKALARIAAEAGEGRRFPARDPSASSRASADAHSPPLGPYPSALEEHVAEDAEERSAATEAAAHAAAPRSSAAQERQRVGGEPFAAERQTPSPTGLPAAAQAGEKAPKLAASVCEPSSSSGLPGALELRSSISQQQTPAETLPCQGGAARAQTRENVAPGATNPQPPLRAVEAAGESPPATLTAAVSESEERGEQRGVRNSSIQQAESSPPAAEGQVALDPAPLRAAAEFLASALLTQLEGRTSAVDPLKEKKDLNAAQGRPPLRTSEPAHRGWVRSFLTSFSGQGASPSAGHPSGGRGPLGGRSYADSGACESGLPVQSPLTGDGSATGGKLEACCTGEGRGLSDAVEESAGRGGVAARWQLRLGALSAAVRRCMRAAASWRRLETGLIGGSAKTGAETQRKVLWVPVSLLAGDSAVWAAVAAVGGEALAAAMKARVVEGLGGQDRGSQQEAHAAFGEGAAQVEARFLDLLQEVHIAHPRASGSSMPLWGVLGITVDDSPDVSAQELREGGAASAERHLQRLSDREGPPVLSGTFVQQHTQKKRFQALCLLTGTQAFQSSVAPLAVRALLDAVSSEHAETKLGAVEALARLTRREGDSEVLFSVVSRELQRKGEGSEEPFRCRLQEGLAAAIIAALDFLYALCMNEEAVIQHLRGCASLKASLKKVIEFCSGKLSPSRPFSVPLGPSVVTDAEGARSSGAANEASTVAAETSELPRVSHMLPPIERHQRARLQHARPLRLATVLASALGEGPQWRPRVPGQRGLRILALDGGGTRGVLTVALLKEIAAAVGTAELSGIFDIICGTSTGGVIALLLGLERATTEELEALYDALISEIFVKDSAAVAGARLVVRQAYYDESLWESLLLRAFGDTRMIDFAADTSVPKVFCLSTRVSTNPAKLVVWRNYNYPHLPAAGTSPSERGPQLAGSGLRRILSLFKRSSGQPYGCSSRLSPATGQAAEGARYEGSCCVRVRDALRATTAAPGFFSGKKMGRELLADGALLANNPTAVAIAEARALYPGVPIELVVSVGTGKCASERCDTRTGWDGIFTQLVNAATNTETIHELLTELLPPSIYFRFNPEIDTVSIDETSKERLDKLKLAARRYADAPKNKEAIQRLADILRPEYPLQKTSRSLVRSLAAHTAEAGKWVYSAGARSLGALRTAMQAPVRPSDSAFVRLVKCCFLAPAEGQSADIGGSLWQRSPEKEAEGSHACAEAPTAPKAFAEDADPGGPDDERSKAQRPSVERKNASGEGGSEVGLDAPPDGSQDDSTLNLGSEVFSGGRRSFLAWLLRYPRSKAGTPSNGAFDMLELVGRRHLSSVNEDETETLVPLTGVRHVLHGIFQRIRAQP
ncbi:patatin-like phospholipase domain-containing protein [Cyclospora cayetanensis]|uniref:Patatin-like phospholipase domain-containing protein n=1 Tax=Cyclospora cayetanensis TaxID=88456 RepID=A0A1D3D005_9EIME|nr:patatin-like phospholipase domain-containing protein [Cyclospora cayetanensis]